MRSVWNANLKFVERKETENSKVKKNKRDVNPRKPKWKQKLKQKIPKKLLNENVKICLLILVNKIKNFLNN